MSCGATQISHEESRTASTTRRTRRGKLRVPLFRFSSSRLIFSCEGREERGEVESCGIMFLKKSRLPCLPVKKRVSLSQLFIDSMKEFLLDRSQRFLKHISTRSRCWCKKRNVVFFFSRLLRIPFEAARAPKGDKKNVH